MDKKKKNYILKTKISIAKKKLMKKKSNCKLKRCAKVQEKLVSGRGEVLQRVGRRASKIAGIFLGGPMTGRAGGEAKKNLVKSSN